MVSKSQIILTIRTSVHTQQRTIYNPEIKYMGAYSCTLVSYHKVELHQTGWH